MSDYRSEEEDREDGDLVCSFIYGSAETWLLRKEDIKRIEALEM